MEPSSEITGNETTIMYSSKLEFYQDQKRKIDKKIEFFYTTERKKIEENINDELPTMLDKVREKKKAGEKDQDDLKLLKEQA